MLKNYPVIINNTTLFQATKWTENWKKVTNTYMTEAGTEQIDVVRQRKLSVAAQYDCSSEWIGQFVTWNQAGTLTVQMYDLLTGLYATRSMHMEDLAVTLVEGSEKTENTDGLYQVTFTLEEF